MDTLEAIRQKRAIRQFKPEPVPEDIIRKIVDAGRHSQSSKNTQPWTFIVIRDRETLKKLSLCGKYAQHIAGASFAVAIISDVEWSFDIGQAAAYLQLAAWDLGIGSVIAYIHEPDRAKQILGVPADKHFQIEISFGYPASPKEEKPKKGGRHSIEEVVRWEHW